MIQTQNIFKTKIPAYFLALCYLLMKKQDGTDGF